MRSVTDEISIVELERLLFPPDGKRPSKLSTEDFKALSAKLDALVDQYGEDRLSAIRRELTMIIGGQVVRADMCHKSLGSR